MLRPWVLNVAIDRNSAVAIHAQIADQIIDAIHNQRFRPGTALPGSRELAKKIKVNRKTVIQAYDELIAQGWLISENKRGTFVSSKSQRSKPSTMPHKLSKLSLVSSSIESINHANKGVHEHLHFNEGWADNRLLPFEAISRAMRHALIASTRHQQSYFTDPKGHLDLRLAIVEMLNLERGLQTNSANLCLLSNSQMANFIIAKTLIQKDEYVVFEELSDPMARQAFLNCGANILTIAHDDDGIDIINLELLCLQYKIRAIYLRPQQQTPTNTRLSDKRRQQLLEMAEQYHFLIIEDDSRQEYNFSDRVTLPIASQSKSSKLIYIGSATTLLGEGLNSSFIVADEEKIKQCATQAYLMAGIGNPICQIALAELLRNGEVKRHRARSLKLYRERKNHVIALLRDELFDFAHFKLPESTLAIWLTLHTTINMAKLQADAETKNVSFIPASYYSTSNHQIPAICLGYAHLNEAELSLGIQRLKSAFMLQQSHLLRA